MKINFGDYTYYNPNSEDKKAYTFSAINKSQENISLLDKQFDEEKFNAFITNKDYQGAIDYASQYSFNDPEVDRNFRSSLLNLKREGNKMKAIYQAYDDKDSFDKLDYINAFNSNSLESLGANKYLDQWNEFKAQLGGEGSTKLKVTFAPQKRTFMGMNNWLADVLVKDNQNTINNFYERSGFSKQYLQQQGVRISQDEKGNDIIEFDKSNPLANKIIVNIADYYQGSDLERNTGFKSTDVLLGNGWIDTDIKGYDANGTETKYKERDTQGWLDYLLPSASVALNPILGAFHAMNLPTAQRNKDLYDSRLLRNIHKLQADAQQVLSQFDIGQLQKSMRYTSTVGDSLTPVLDDLKAQVARGEITESQMYSIYATKKENALSWIYNIGANHFDFYTNGMSDDDMYADNYGDSKETDDALRLVKPEHRQKVLDTLRGIKLEDLDIKTMISNGQIGAVITIPGIDQKAEKLNEDKSRLDKRSQGKSIQVFIPGFLHDKAQQQINSDTRLRGIDEFNNMQKHSYIYDTSDGRAIKAIGDGTFQIDNKRVSEAEAKHEICKDVAIDDARASLKYRYINSSNNIIDAQLYEDNAKKLAYALAMELNGGQFTDVNGKPLDINKVFELKGIGATVNNNDKTKIPFDIALKLQDVYDIYEALMSDLKYYL